VDVEVVAAAVVAAALFDRRLREAGQAGNGGQTNKLTEGVRACVWEDAEQRTDKETGRSVIDTVCSAEELDCGRNETVGSSSGSRWKRRER
jgi:hypothetical protein